MGRSVRNTFKHKEQRVQRLWGRARRVEVKEQQGGWGGWCVVYLRGRVGGRWGVAESD